MTREELIAECRHRSEAGEDAETIIRYLRVSGCSKIDSIAILNGACGIGLAKAKEIVHFSATWADRKASDEKFHEDLVMTAYDDEIRKTLKAEIDAGRLKEVGDPADIFGLVKKI
jgi:hypothetical protein